MFWKKAGAILLAAILLCGCAKSTKTPQGVVSINGENISRAEFLLYYYESQMYFESSGGQDIWKTDFNGQSAQEVAKERALTSLKTVKLSAAHASDFGVKLTDDQKSTAATQAQSLYDSLTQEERDYIGLAREEYDRILQENAVYQAVFSAIAQGFALDQTDFEAYYQAVRRCWRFGQTEPVTVHVVTSDTEGAVKANIERKQADAQHMTSEMVKYTRDILRADIRGTARIQDDYRPQLEMQLPEWLREVA